MTRPAQKAEERRALSSVLEILGCQVPIVDGPDPPDLVIKLNGRKIGVEATRYQEDTPASPAKHSRPMVEATWQRFRQRAMMTIAQARPEAGGIAVFLSFCPLEIPPKREWDQCINEVVSFVETKRHELGPEYKGYSSWETGAPLLRRYLNSISLAVHGEYADWTWNGTAGWIGPPSDARVQAIVVEKATRNYPPRYDELWLIIYGGEAISRTFVVSDVAELHRLTSANAQLASGKFDLVALWDPFRRHVYEWTQTHGWRVRSQTR